MKISPMTAYVVEACPAAAVRSDRRAVNRLAPMFGNVSGQNSALRTAGITLSCSGHEPGSPPD